jgi:uncharacterized protein YegL
MNNELLFNDVNFDPGQNNFDPDQIQGSETINAVFVVDVSPSITNYENELNDAFNSFIEEMQKSHIAETLFVSTIEFTEKIVSKKGFQPVSNVQKSDFRGQGSGTALFDAVKIGLQNALDYRKAQLKSGITCKTLLFVITDGQDNSSNINSAHNVKQMHDDIMQDEANAFSFTSILFGINQMAQSDFERAKNEMGIQFLAKVGVTAKEIRKMISWISSSISSSASGKVITAPVF